MFVALSTFRVANGMEDQVTEAFLKRPHAVDNEPGFIRPEVLRPVDDASEFWLITWWSDQQSWETWYRSERHKRSHDGIPKGLKLDPSATQVHKLQLLAT